MKAMVFAAGLGTRLRPLTDDRPKALVTVAGRTLLEITLSRLRTFGVREVIVNVHHFADQVVAYLAANQNFGMRIEVSREEVSPRHRRRTEESRMVFPRWKEPRRSYSPAVHPPQRRHRQHHRYRSPCRGSQGRERALHLRRAGPRDRALSTFRRAGHSLRPPQRARWSGQACPASRLTACARILLHSRRIPAHLRKADGGGRLFHHRRLSSPRRAGRKDCLLPRRRRLLARSRPAQRPNRRRKRCGRRAISGDSLAYSSSSGPEQ